MMYLKKLLKYKILISFILLQIVIILGIKIYSEHSITNKVKSRIEKDYPAIKDPHISEIEKLNLIRQWTSTNVIWGSDSTNINHEVSQKNLYDMFNTFDKSEGSINCGVVSLILMKIYEAYGYESYTYHAGSLDKFNHAITLVRIKNNGKKILMIQDASFDLTFLDNKGNPYDFYDFIRTIKTGDIKDINISPGKGRPHFYLCDKSDICNRPSINNSLMTVSKERVKFLEKFSTYRIENNMHIYLVNRGIFASNNKRNTEPIKKQLSELLN